jgi:HlyD family secretion protein
MTGRRWWTLLGLAAMVAVVAAVVSGRITLPESAIEVESATVTRGPLTVTVDEEGQTRVKDRYVVAAPVGGRVARIAVREGDSVSKGDILARIFPTPEDPRTVEVSRGRLAAAEARQIEGAAQVERTRAAHAQAARDLVRTDDLVDAGVTSQDSLEQARLAATVARQQLEMSEAALSAVEADVAAARAALVGVNPDASEGTAVVVRAPAPGRVFRVPQGSARVVQAGTPLVEIGDGAGLEVVVDVLSEDAVRIEPGNPVQIEEWGGETALRGTVRLLEPEAFTKLSALGVEEQRVNIVVDLVDPPTSLGAGYRLEARIVTWTDENVVRVPTSALFQQDDTWALFLVQAERAVRRPVRIGHRASDSAEILEGVEEGDRVILYPSAVVDDGVLVK